MTNPRQVLGVGPEATPDQIKSAYRALAMKYHPDRNPDDAAAVEKFKEVTAAYEDLTKPQPQHQNHFDHDQAHFNDLFSQVFGNHFNFNFNQPTRNHDISLRCQITLEQAFFGTEINVNLADFAGTGRAPVGVSIPAGVQTGETLIVNGAGRIENPAIPAGDLRLTIVIADHERMQRNGDHLFVHATIDALSAIVGTSTRVQLLDGSEIDVTVPAGVQHGNKLRVAGGGMPQRSSSKRGDLFVIVDIVIPRGLNDSHREVVKRLTEMLPD